MSLRKSLLLVVTLALLGGIVPAGLITSRELSKRIEERSREDLDRAAMVLKDRWSIAADMRMMHAQDIARVPELGRALMRDDDALADSVITAAASNFLEAPVLVDRNGNLVAGTTIPPLELLDATRRGEMQVGIVDGPDGPDLVALAPVKMGDNWVGAAGGVTPYGLVEAGILAGLTRSGVIILGKNGSVSSATVDDSVAIAIASTLAAESSEVVHAINFEEHPYLALAVEPASGTRVLFVKDVRDDLAVISSLRTTALITSVAASALALILGAFFAGRIARPVASLAGVADRLSSGDFDAPVPRSAIDEVDSLAMSFERMRETMVQRLHDLENANCELEARQEKLALLQAELVQRERLAAAGQLVTQLAHEIRNPIASVRNCLEVLRRFSEGDAEASRFADMAVDELLRMHELAEQMLELNRPSGQTDPRCDVRQVCLEVAGLIDAGSSDLDGGRLVVECPGVTAAIDHDALKQVLFNIALNAREAAGNSANVELNVAAIDDLIVIQVRDHGPGIPPEILPRIFDPFFTTKDAVHGVGLGLFMAEAMVRTVGGRLSATNREDGDGAAFRIELPLGRLEGANA